MPPPPPPPPADATPAALSALLKALSRPPPEEWPAEPELKADRQRQDAELREQQDLASGAVLEAPLEPAFGGVSTGDDADDANTNTPPQPGDVVLVHLTVRAVEEEGGLGSNDDFGPGSPARVLFTTRADEAGAVAAKSAASLGALARKATPVTASNSSTGGAPVAFRLGKGRTRPPRALELALSRMHPGERRMVRAAHRAYGFSHPDCGLAGLLPLKTGDGEDDEEAEEGGSASSTIPDLVAFDVELLRVLPSHGRGGDEDDEDDDEDDDESSSSDDDDEFDPNETDRAAIERRLKQLQAKKAAKAEKKKKQKKQSGASSSAAPVRALVYLRGDEGAEQTTSSTINNPNDELDDLFKRTLRDSDSWESARAPNEATFALALRPLAADGVPLGAAPYFEAPADSPLSVPLGQGLLPRGVELALEHTTRGEKALFIVPARLMRMMTTGADKSGQGKAASSSSSTTLIPPPPAGAYQVELCVELLDLVQVRDLAGDGGATKRRLREGKGTFPADCPLHDTTVRLHWRARRLPFSDPSSAEAAEPLPAMPVPPKEDEEDVVGEDDEDEEDWQWPGDDDREGAQWSYDSRADPSLRGRALRVDTGCGDLPAALELAVRLMTPGEIAAVRFSRRYAQPAPATGDAAAAAALRAAAAEDARRARESKKSGRSSAPQQQQQHAYEYQVRLVSFEREGYWQRLNWKARLQLAERIKSKGNALYKAGKAAAAAGRYDHLLRLLASTRDFDAPDNEDDEEDNEEEEEDNEEERARVAEARAAAVDALRGAALANLAAAALAAGDGARALKACDAADEMEGLPGAPDPAKVAFRRARALAMMAEPERADAEFERAAAMLQARVEEEGGKEEGGGEGASASAAAAASLAEVRAAQRRARLEAKQHAAQQRAAMGNFFARNK